MYNKVLTYLLTKCCWVLKCH